jgi:hypothetical protein
LSGIAGLLAAGMLWPDFLLAKKRLLYKNTVNGF